MARANPDTWRNSISMYVPNCQYVAEVGRDGEAFIEYGAIVAADTDGILAAQSIAAATTQRTLANTYSQANMGRYGRGVTVVASGAATSTLRVDGKDYWGQPMSETFTLNGTTPVLGVKMFASVTAVTVLTTTGSTTVDVGWGVRQGVPYKATQFIAAFEDGVAATAGTPVVGSNTSPQIATTADPRGYYTFNNAPNGTRTYGLSIRVDQANMMGNAHYSA